MSKISRSSVAKAAGYAPYITVVLVIWVSAARPRYFIPAVSKPQAAFIQVGAFKNADSAAGVTSQFNSEGYAAHTLPGSDFHRVLIGPFFNKWQAQRALTVLIARGHDGWVRDDLPASRVAALGPLFAAPGISLSGHECGQDCSEAAYNVVPTLPGFKQKRRQPISTGKNRNQGSPISAKWANFPSSRYPTPKDAPAEPSIGALESDRRLERLKTRLCATCHESRRPGGNAPTLNRPTSRGRTPAAMTAVMWNHAPAVWRTMGSTRQSGSLEFSRTQILRLYGQFLALRFFDPPGDAGRGKRLYVSNGCARCHPLNDGREASSPLSPVRSIVLDRARWLKEMWCHADRAGSEMEKAGIRPKLFSVQEMSDLMVYLDQGAVGRFQEPELTLGDPKTGQAIFQAAGCSQCHTMGETVDQKLDLLDGGGERKTTKRTLVAKVTLFRWLSRPARKRLHSQGRNFSGFGAQLWNHQELRRAAGMSAIGLSRAEDMAHLIAYFLETGYFFRTQGKARRGLRVFRKKKCAACHAQSLLLAQREAGKSEALSQSMGLALWRHAPEAKAGMQSGAGEWPVLTEKNVEDLLETLRGKTLVTFSPARRPLSDGLIAQVGAFKDPKLAATLSKRLRERGYSAESSRSSDFSRVLVGPFASEAQAAATVKRLRDDGYDAYLKPQPRQ